jgi:hypothetical protein
VNSGIAGFLAEHHRASRIPRDALTASIPVTEEKPAHGDAARAQSARSRAMASPAVPQRAAGARIVRAAVRPPRAAHAVLQIRRLVGAFQEMHVLLELRL